MSPMAANSKTWLCFELGTIHLRRRQTFTIFDPYSLHRQFFNIICGQFWHSFDPYPLINVNILNEWSLTYVAGI